MRRFLQGTGCSGRALEPVGPRVEVEVAGRRRSGAAIRARARANERIGVAQAYRWLSALVSKLRAENIKKDNKLLKGIVKKGKDEEPGPSVPVTDLDFVDALAQGGAPDGELLNRGEQLGVAGGVAVPLR